MDKTCIKYPDTEGISTVEISTVGSSTMNSIKTAELSTEISEESKRKEMEIRAWIARKESVCPYAPGLARFIHLPKIDSMKMDHVYYLARELKAFYEDKVNGNRVGRWMLMPHSEWQSHDEARCYSERIFWLLNAAYYHLMRDKKSVQAAIKKELPGFERGHKGDIINSIIGKQPNPNANIVPAKSLFFSALSSLYRSKKFFRYCPYSVMPLVYASEFQELKTKHTQVTENVTFDMATRGLHEILGDNIELDLADFKQELPHWGAIVDRTAAVLRAHEHGISSKSHEARGCPGSNLSLFRLSPPELVEAFFVKHTALLPILSDLVESSGVPPKDIIMGVFPGSGLYVLPDYPQSYKHSPKYF